MPQTTDDFTAHGTIVNTPAQTRLLGLLAARGGAEQYWALANDWARDDGPIRPLVLRNINRTIDVLIRQQQIAIDDDGTVTLRHDVVTCP